MSSAFDHSPRSSKRRKISQYKKQRTTLPEDDGIEAGSFGDAPIDEDDRHMSDKEEQTRNSGEDTPTSLIVQIPARLPKQRSQQSNATTEGTPQSSRTSRAVSSRQIAQKGVTSRSSKKHKDHESQNQDSPTRNGITNGTHADTNGTHSKDNVDAGSGDKDEEAVLTRSSGRQRKKPARYLESESRRVSSPVKRSSALVTDEIVELSATESPLKGILTPSKRPKIRPRKSVVFIQDVDTLGEQFGFRDIDPQAKSTPVKEPQKQKRRSTTEPVSRQLQSPSTTEPVVLEETDALDLMLIDNVAPSPLVPDFEASKLNLLNPPAIDEHDSLTSLKSTILSRLTRTPKFNTSQAPPPHLSSQYSALHTLLTATVSASESNSLLLLGPRGSGKSYLLDMSLANLTDEYGPDFFHTIRLSGFLQTDDRLALREIWRQLGREMKIDEEETEDVAGSYADTMASLLSLLSHPDEMETDPASASVNGTINPEILAQDVLEVMTNGDDLRKTSKSIIFILDEFDLFTTHPRQTLLYNLFDIAQSRKAPIAVIGCSTRMDVIECLEKRVKSRFSHRWLLVPGCPTLAEWEECVKNTLAIDVDGKDMLRTTLEERELAERWNRYILDHFLQTDQVQKLTRSHFYTTKALPDLFIALYPLIATLDISTDPVASLSKSSKATDTVSQSYAILSVLSVLPTLPTIHFSLLISATRLVTIHSLPAVNFNLVHAHYTELMARSRLQQSVHGSIAVSGSSREWNRETCREAWEELGQLGMIVSVVGQGVDGGTDGIEGEETRMWRCEVSLEEVEWGTREKFGNADGSTSAGPGEILSTWCREV